MLTHWWTQAYKILSASMVADGGRFREKGLLLLCSIHSERWCFGMHAIFKTWESTFSIQSLHLGRSPLSSVQTLQHAWQCRLLILPPPPCCLFAWSSPFGSLPIISPCHFLHSCTHRLHKRRGLGLSQALTELRNHILSNGDQGVSQCVMICMARMAICPFLERNEIKQRNGSTNKNSLSDY